jgi:hypothetical protein
VAPSGSAVQLTGAGRQAIVVGDGLPPLLGELCHRRVSAHALVLLGQPLLRGSSERRLGRAPRPTEPVHGDQPAVGETEPR